jgi:hypothetical protein
LVVGGGGCHLLGPRRAFACRAHVELLRGFQGHGDGLESDLSVLGCDLSGAARWLVSGVVGGGGWWWWVGWAGGGDLVRSGDGGAARRPALPGEARAHDLHIFLEQANCLCARRQHGNGLLHGGLPLPEDENEVGVFDPRLKIADGHGGDVDGPEWCA